MKPIRLILLFISMTVATSVVAQSPQRFNYQAVARDASGNPLSEKTLGVRISILDNSEAGADLYSETFSPTTNKQGLFSVQVGGGDGPSGSFNTIQWGTSAKFLKVEIDAAGGSSYQLLGTSQLLSVPYALAADRLSSQLSTTDLKDVSAVVPIVDQVLQWDGTQWAPGSGSALTTSTEFSGAGTSVDPLKIAPQGATNGQVMQWNGANWAPATVSGGVGDNWGTQTVVSSTVLQGIGTAASPLTIAQQAASTGMVLKWDGAKWTPGNVTGDNWGTAKVNTSTQFGGDGTPGNPLKLAANSASAGQFLKFDGTNWIPGDAGGGSLTLPSSGNVSDPGVALQIQNTAGTGVVGINASAAGNNVYGLQGRVLNSTGANTYGVYGLHGSTGSNGSGVYGLHSGSGSGVTGESAGAGIGINGKAGNNGIGVYGAANGSSSYGVVGLGNTGISGTTNTAAGKGVYGTATAGGFAGWFDGKTMLRFNSTATDPNLYIWEDDVNDKAKVRFNNGVTNEFWDITAFTPSSGGLGSDRFAVSHFSGGDIFTVTGDKKVGINLSNPETELDINGSMKIFGGIKANSSFGANGQVLQSTGGGVQWASGTSAAFNNTYLYDQTSTLAVTTSAAPPVGLNNMIFTTTGAARVDFTFSHGQFVSTGAEVEYTVEMGFMNSTNSSIINRTFASGVVPAGKKANFSFTHHCFFGSAGTYWPYIYITTTSGTFNAVATNSAGQVVIHVVQQ
jgi:hypothetical protein